MRWFSILIGAQTGAGCEKRVKTKRDYIERVRYGAIKCRPPF